MIKVITVYTLDSTIDIECDYSLDMAMWEKTLEIMGFTYSDITGWWISEDDTEMVYLEEV